MTVARLRRRLASERCLHCLWSLAGHCLLDPRIRSAGRTELDAHLTGPSDYFGLRQRDFFNAQDATSVLVMAATHFVPLIRPLDSICPNHAPKTLGTDRVGFIDSARVNSHQNTLCSLFKDEDSLNQTEGLSERHQYLIRLAEIQAPPCT